MASVMIISGVWAVIVVIGLIIWLGIDLTQSCPRCRSKRVARYSAAKSPHQDGRPAYICCVCGQSWRA